MIITLVNSSGKGGCRVPLTAAETEVFRNLKGLRYFTEPGIFCSFLTLGKQKLKFSGHRFFPQLGLMNKLSWCLELVNILKHILILLALSSKRNFRTVSDKTRVGLMLESHSCDLLRSSRRSKVDSSVSGPQCF